MPQVVSREEWLAARKALLAKEKEFTRARDALSAERRRMPWVRVDKSYVFDGPAGKESLADLFGGKSQLAIYHFMYGPDWKEGCKSCSFWADNLDGIDIHLAHRDVSFVVVSRAPLAVLDAYKKRMGWRFKWMSSLGSDFNADYHVSHPKGDEPVYYNYEMRRFPSDEAPGLSVFLQKGGHIFHTYSTYARGLDILNSAYNLLDMMPKGRDEDDQPYTMAWLRHRDRYDD
jgi:predicted dithiol-disulfide oxidoreductase (DUF899 family)